MEVSGKVKHTQITQLGQTFSSLNPPAFPNDTVLPPSAINEKDLIQHQNEAMDSLSSELIKSKSHNRVAKTDVISLCNVCSLKEESTQSTVPGTSTEVTANKCHIECKSHISANQSESCTCELDIFQGKAALLNKHIPVDEIKPEEMDFVSYIDHSFKEALGCGDDEVIKDSCVCIVKKEEQISQEIYINVHKDKTAVTLQKSKEIGMTLQHPEELAMTLQQQEETDMTLQQQEETGMTLQQPGETSMTLQQPGETDVTLQQPGETDVTLQQPGEIAVTLQQPEETDVTLQQTEETNGTLQQPDKTGVTLQLTEETGVTLTESRVTAVTFNQSNDAKQQLQLSVINSQESYDSSPVSQINDDIFIDDENDNTIEDNDESFKDFDPAIDSQDLVSFEGKQVSEVVNKNKYINIEPVGKESLGSNYMKEATENAYECIKQVVDEKEALQLNANSDLDDLENDTSDDDDGSFAEPTKYDKTSDLTTKSATEKIRPVMRKRKKYSTRARKDSSKTKKKKRVAVQTKRSEYECRECREMFSTATGLKRHAIIEHEIEKPFHCGICDKSFVSIKSLNRHEKDHPDSREICDDKKGTCRFCGKCYSSPAKLEIHLRTHTGEKPYKCKLCDKRFVQKSQLNVHKRVHTGEKPYKCEICAKYYKHSSTRNQCMNRHQGVEAPKIHKCELCGKCFDQNAKLQYHMKTHTGEKPFKCKFCDKCFSRKDSVDSHMRTHTGEKPFKCEECGRPFATRTALNMHKRQHTGETPYTCGVCNKSFKQSTHLNTHMRTHSGVRPYKCEECGYAAKCNSQLKQHALRHTNIKEFKCSLCEKDFYTRYQLKVHMRKHTGEKPYTCDVCGGKFAHLDGLRQHTRKHTGEKPYKCDRCGECYARSDSLKTHLKKHKSKQKS